MGCNLFAQGCNLRGKGCNLRGKGCNLKWTARDYYFLSLYRGSEKSGPLFFGQTTSDECRACMALIVKQCYGIEDFI